MKTCMISPRFSAADIEKYTYCPLSWKLSYSDEDVATAEQKAGKKAHKEYTKSIKKVLTMEGEALRAEAFVVICGIIATVLAISGTIIYSPLYKDIVSRITLIVALIWLGVSIILLYLSAFFPHQKSAPRFLLLTGVLAGLLFLISVFTYAFQHPYIALIFEPIALLWLIFTSFFFFISEWYSSTALQIRRKIKIENSHIMLQSDKKPLISRDGLLSGTPDLILKINDYLVPVEIKTGRVPRGPHFSHIMQLIAYCYIIEDVDGKAPPYGILRYGDTEFEIEYNSEWKCILLSKVEEMRNVVAGNAEVHRNHNRPGKCRNCSRRAICPEKLV
ncbi:MAG: PD-(D/E)XK nuclease family protein [Thermoplasmata archaeon]